MAGKKECPSCAMDIDSNAKECPICGYEFPRYSTPFKLAAIILAILIILLMVL